MPVFRFLAGVFSLLAVIVLVSDISSPATPSALMSIDDHWRALSPASRESAKAALVSRELGSLWDYGAAPLLSMPTVLLLVLGAGLAGYAGRRRDKINVFIN